jgi:hypothetical protein
MRKRIELLLIALLCKIVVDIFPAEFHLAHAEVAPKQAETPTGQTSCGSM